MKFRRCRAAKCTLLRRLATPAGKHPSPRRKSRDEFFENRFGDAQMRIGRRSGAHVRGGASACFGYKHGTFPASRGFHFHPALRPIRNRTRGYRSLFAGRAVDCAQGGGTRRQPRAATPHAAWRPAPPQRFTCLLLGTSWTGSFYRARGSPVRAKFQIQHLETNDRAFAAMFRSRDLCLSAA